MRSPPRPAFPTPHLRAVVDLEALRHNLALVQRRLPAQTELIASVKANAYGHGLKIVARCLEGEGVRWLALGNAEEALALRRWGVSCRILLFPPVAYDDVRGLLKANVTIAIQSYAEAECVARVAGGPVSVFLKIDSGLGRVGVPVADAPSVARRVTANLPGVRLEGVFTHLPFSSADQIPWAQAGLTEFGRTVATIREHAKLPLLIQALATTGIVCRLEAPAANAVCLGQLLFGIEPGWAPEVTGTSSFGTRPVLTAVSTVVGSFRTVPQGARFGAGGARTSARETRLGVLPVGYSNSTLTRTAGQVTYIGGHPVPIISISLEHAVVDLTEIPGVEEGSQAVLLARDPTAGIPLDDVARIQGRSGLEVLVCLTGRAVYEYVGSVPADHALEAEQRA